MRPKDVKLDLDIEEEDEFSGTESEGGVKKESLTKS